MPKAQMIQRCPAPSEPGLFLVRRHRGGMLSLAEVKRNKEGCLEVNTFYGALLLSGFGPEAKWWGPIELKKSLPSRVNQKNFD